MHTINTENMSGRLANLPITSATQHVLAELEFSRFSVVEVLQRNPGERQELPSTVHLSSSKVSFNQHHVICTRPLNLQRPKCCSEAAFVLASPMEPTKNLNTKLQKLTSLPVKGSLKHFVPLLSVTDYAIKAQFKCIHRGTIVTTIGVQMMGY